MHQLYSLIDARKLITFKQLWWQPVFNRKPLEVIQRLQAQLPDPGLLNALSKRVNWREGRLPCSGHGRRVYLVFRMVKFVTGPARANLTKAAYACSFGQLVFLGCIEVKKPQHQKTAVVFECHLQAAAPAHYQVGFHYLTFNHRNIAKTQTSHRGNTSAVFIPMRKVKQQILQGDNTQFTQLASQSVSDAL